MQNDKTVNQDILEQIEKIIETEVRPQLMSHQGDVQVLSFEDGICRVKLLGQCSGCPSAMLTTEEIIGKAIKEKLAQVKDVVLVQNVDESLMDFARKLLNHEKTDH